jgi:hypothetical protein
MAERTQPIQEQYAQNTIHQAASAGDAWPLRDMPVRTKCVVEVVTAPNTFLATEEHGFLITARISHQHCPEPGGDCFESKAVAGLMNYEAKKVFLCLDNSLSLGTLKRAFQKHETIVAASSRRT